MFNIVEDQIDPTYEITIPTNKCFYKVTFIDDSLFENWIEPTIDENYIYSGLHHANNMLLSDEQFYKVSGTSVNYPKSSIKNIFLHTLPLNVQMTVKKSDLYIYIDGKKKPLSNFDKKEIPINIPSDIVNSISFCINHIGNS